MSLWQRFTGRVPGFKLECHDVLTPHVMTHWIEEAKHRGLPKYKIQKVVDHLDEILKWQRENPTMVKLKQ